MAYYRRKFTKKEEMRFNIAIGILMIPIGFAGCIVCIVAFIGLIVGIFKGTLTIGGLGAVGFVYFFIGGIAYLFFLGIETLKDGLKLRQELKKENESVIKEE